MNSYYRINVIAHFKPARYSNTYFLLPEAHEVYEEVKKKWESGDYDYFSSIRGRDTDQVQKQIDDLEALPECTSEQDYQLECLYRELEDLEDDNIMEFMYQSELVASDVSYPHIILDEFTAYDE